MNMFLEQSLDCLAVALAEERRAILEHDVEALISSTRQKLDALQAVEGAFAKAGDAGIGERVAALARANTANGALLARRRREVNWTLRHLGRSESSGAYDVHGQTSTLNSTRALAIV